MVNYPLVGLACAMFAGGIGLGIYIADSEGQLSFLKPAHYISLILLIIAYILSWAAMTWMSSPDKFQIRPKQWIAFGFTLLMAVFWWGRYVFTVADTAETAPK